jgi:hypothetical protein
VLLLLACHHLHLHRGNTSNTGISTASNSTQQVDSTDKSLCLDERILLATSLLIPFGRHPVYLCVTRTVQLLYMQQLSLPATCHSQYEDTGAQAPSGPATATVTVAAL